jgi:predicted ferric reductase
VEAWQELNQPLPLDWIFVGFGLAPFGAGWEVNMVQKAIVGVLISFFLLSYAKGNQTEDSMENLQEEMENVEKKVEKAENGCVDKQNEAKCDHEKSESEGSADHLLKRPARRSAGTGG